MGGRVGPVAAWLDVCGEGGDEADPLGALGFTPAAPGCLPGLGWEMLSVYNLVSWETRRRLF